MWRFAVVAVAAAACGRVDFDPVDNDASSAVDLACANADPHLLACYAFEQATTDASGGGHDGVATSVTYIAGHAGSAIQLDGAGQVDIAAAASLQPANQASATLEAWVRTDAVPAAGERYVIIDHGNGIVLSIGPGSTLRFDVHLSAVGTVTSGPNAIVPGRWTRVAGIYNSTDLTVWIDGTIAAFQPSTGAVMFEAGAGVRIGGNLSDVNNPNPDRLLGAIDDVRIWDAVATQ